MVLQVNFPTIFRSGRTLLTNIQFRVLDGSPLVLYGKNGIGKSTILRLIAGLIPIKIGNIEYNGTDITNDNDLKTSLISLVGHSNGLNPNLTVWEQIIFWKILFNFSEPSIEKLLNLEEIKHQKICNCSTGQKRRLALARPIMSNRKIWLLDEPTSSLDEQTTSLICKIIDMHCRKGGSALIATHQELRLFNATKLELYSEII